MVHTRNGLHEDGEYYVGIGTIGENNQPKRGMEIGC